METNDCNVKERIHLYETLDKLDEQVKLSTGIAEKTEKLANAIMGAQPIDAVATQESIENSTCLIDRFSNTIDTLSRNLKRIDVAISRI